MTSSNNDKVTIVNAFPVYPPQSGGQQRVFHVAESLSSCYDVTVLTVSHRVPDETVTQGRLKIKNVCQRALLLTALLSRISNLPINDTLLPATSRLLYGFQKELKSNVSASSIIICERPCLFRTIYPLSRGKLLVFTAHDVEADVKEEMYHRLGPLKAPVIRYIKRQESMACRKSDVVVTVSEENKKRLSSLYDIPEEKIIVVPNGVSLTGISPPSAACQSQAKNALGLAGRRVITFIGSRYYANQEAARFIIGDVAPALRDCQFMIAGNLGIDDRASLPGNVTVTGFIDDDMKRTILAATDIAVNPMSRGSGTNLKMLEYMAWGIPVVTTPMGARGLDVEDNINVIISRDGDFTKSLEKLLADRELQRTIGQGGRKLVEQSYDWASIGKILTETLERKKAL